MPRLSHQLLAKAWKENSLLPLLLRSCRDLPSARRELQWLTEHAISSHQRKYGRAANWQPLLHKLCHERSRGKPLQYILGSEYFGPLEITCKPGVLIPRQETAASVMYLAERLGNDDCLRPSSKSLKVLDLCTGTGCIPLLFARMFHFAKTGVEHLDILGVDISSNAVELAKQNQQSVRQQYHAQRMEDNPSVDTYRLAALSNTKFLQADILSQPEDPHQAITRIPESSPKQPTDLCTSLYHEGHGKKWDILISNPPYISPSHFQKTTSRSVRNYEPKLALVPPHLTGVLTWSPASGVTQNLTDEQQGDLFYPRLLHLAEEFQTKVLLMEVADLEQAERVAALAVRGGQWSGVEIWCDEPSLSAHPERKSRVRDVPILGQGNGRSVFGWRGG